MLVSKLRYFHVLAGLGLAGVMMLSAVADQKSGMPDLSQEEQTCLPTSTANLIIWFGHHGYPRLILSGDTEEDRELHTVHAIMSATNARYDIGTRTDEITSGIEKYVRNAGYSCDVEYRGMDWGMARQPEALKDYEGDRFRQFYTRPAAFTQDWLQENNDPNKGFILLLAYCDFDPKTDSYSNAFNAGHVVTLVNAEPNLLLVHDPAHGIDEPGRKILTPLPLTSGIFRLPGYNAPVEGLLLLSGSLLNKPPGAGVMLTGAVCLTMHPDAKGTTLLASAAGVPNATVGGGKDAVSPTKPSAPGSSDSSWSAWLFDYFFKK